MASCHTHAATKLSSHRIRGTHRNDRWGISSHRLHRSFWRKIFSHRLHRFSQIRRVWHPAIPTQPLNYLPTEFAEHTETTGGEEKSVYICEIRGRISSARNFCEFCGRTCANKLGMGSVEGIRRAAWVWQGCHTLLRKLPRIARICTD